MRVSALAAVFCLVVLVTGARVEAAELKLDSRIDAVTVFPRGAEVKRVAESPIKKGAHRLVFPDLPAQTILGSVRVEGRSTGGLEIGAVDGRRVFVSRNDNEAAGAERRRLENEIERLTDTLQSHQADIETKTVQKRFIENLAGLPTRPLPPGGQAGGAPPTNWTTIFDLIGGRLADVQRAMLETQVKIRDVTRQIEDLKKKLASLAPKRFQRTEVVLAVTAAQDLSADFVITYQVRQASWTPYYDARLETGSRTVPAKLVLTRRAEVRQQTDEVWRDVSLALSTTRPSARSSAPTLETVTVDFEPPPRPVAVRESERKRLYRRAPVAQSAPGAGADEVVAAAPMEVAKERDADVQQGAFQAIFSVPDKLTVINTGDMTRVKISDTSLEPALAIRAVPKRDRKGYLYAKIKLPKSAPYLAGRVSLFRDQTFAGFGQLPQLAPGETHELGFGADDLVRVRYDVVGETTGETGLISSSRTDQRRYKITIKNLHERPISYAVLDQLPVAGDEKIKVELKGATAPTERDVKNKRGVVAWSGTLAADEEKIINFGYMVSWPADKNVHYR